MPDDTKTAAPSPAATRTNPPAPVTAKKAADPIGDLRAKYDQLARQTAEAAAAGDEPAVKKLLKQKLAAFQAWHTANESQVREGKPAARAENAARLR